MKQVFFLYLFFGLAFSVHAQQTENFSIYFNVNESQLDSKDKLLLSKHLKFDGDTMFYHIKLEGHADVDGDAQANYELSQRRIKSIKTFMLAHGVDSKNISITAHGERQQISPEKWKNRRVDVHMTFSNVLAEDALTSSYNKSIENPVEVATLTDSSDNPLTAEDSTDSEVKDDVDDTFDLIIAKETIFGLKGDLNEEVRESIFVKQGGQIEYPSGTIISIPPDALVYKDGTSVRGRAEIIYTEFRDPVDIMFSGIPMTYDSAGTQYMMESGGMFDIQAKQGNNELFLAPGKQIDVNFVQTDDQSYNFYQSNNDGHWDNANDLIDQAGSGRGFNTFMNIDMNGWQVNWDKSPELIDYDPALAAIQTGYQFFKPNSRQVAQPTFQDRWISLKYAGVEEADLARSVNNQEHFNIALNNSGTLTSREIVITDLTGRNSELKVFKNQVFKIADDEFLNNFRKRKSACDVRVKYDKGRDVFTLVLKYADGFKKTEAKIIYPITTTDKEALKQNQERFDLYTRLLESRERFFTTHLKFIEMRGGTLITFELEAFWHYSRQFMDKKEKLLSVSEWLRYFYSNEKAMERRYNKLYNGNRGKIREMNKNPKINEALNASYRDGGKGIIQYTKDPYPACGNFEPELLFVDYSNDSIYSATVELISYAIDTTESEFVQQYWQSQLADLAKTQDYKLRQSLAVNGFGVWNCDRLWQIDNKEEILASYEDDEGEKITPVYMSMLFTDRNAALAQDPYHFVYSRTTRAHLVLIDADQNYYIVSDKELRQSIQRNSREHKLVVTPLKLSSPEDLKKALKI